MKEVQITLEKARRRAVQGTGQSPLSPFFNMALDMLCIAGTDGYFKRVNPAFMRTLGYSEEELLDRPFIEFVHPEDQPVTYHEIDKLRQGEETVFFTNRYRHNNGGYRWIEWNAAPAHDRPLIYAAARDITERRRADHRFKLVVNAAPNGVLMIDREGVIILSNPRAGLITGLPPEELTGRSFPELLPRIEREAVMQTVQNCFMKLEQEHPASQDGMVVCADGSMVPVNMTFTLVDSDEGAFVLVVLVDLSERWRTERELQQSAEQIQRSARELHEMRLLLIQAEKMDSMGRLAAGVAHEVKNPLAMLQLGLELIEGRIPDDDVRAKSVLGMMQEAIERANLIVGEMLDISRVRNLEVSPHDINELVSETLRLCQHELVTSKITTLQSLAPTPLLVHVDRAKLLQVFLNLVINATHAMATGGTLEIRTARTSMGEVDRNDGARTSDHLRTHDEVITITLEDTGCGIPEGVLHRIFDPFFTTKPTGKGTGLGLTIAKSIIELHRGAIVLENRKPKGARVTISLPAAPTSSISKPERS